MSKHTISRDLLIAHLEAERWERYASSACVGEQVKFLDISTHRQFRVVVGGEVVYSGQSPTDAVNAYNEERALP